MDEINRIWSKYHTEELIGTGSYGKVYRVRREEMGEKTYAAVKVIHIPQNQSEINDLKTSGMDYNSIRSFYQESVKNLMNEIKLMDSLKSGGNVVSIEDYEVREKEDGIGWDVYIRMELLTNCSDYITKHENKMSESMVIKLGTDICKALQYCERENIIHRDIKLDNIFISRFDDFKLGDFGISKQLEKTKSAMSQKGTSVYMAPEVYKGEKYDKTVDIYSLGILLYRLLNHGRFPFVPGYPLAIRPTDLEDAMIKRMSGAPLEAPDEASAPVAKVILKACAYRAEDRYQSATEMLTDLENCVSMARRMETELDENIVEAVESVNAFVEAKEQMQADERTVSAFGNAMPQTSVNIQAEDKSVQETRLADDKGEALVQNPDFIYWESDVQEDSTTIDSHKAESDNIQRKEATRNALSKLREQFSEMWYGKNYQKKKEIEGKAGREQTAQKKGLPGWVIVIIVIILLWYMVYFDLPFCFGFALY